MKLRDLRRTTSFRMALLFLLLFGAASFTLFGFLYVQTRRHLHMQIDEWLRREQSVFAQLTYDETLERVSARALVDASLERPFVLIDATGHAIVGAPLALAPAEALAMPRSRPFNAMLSLASRTASFRTLIAPLPGGQTLLLAQDLTDSLEFEAFLRDSYLWGILVIAALGLSGAILAGTDAVRRIDAVTLATRRIVAGDLSQRLPDSGGSGDLGRLAVVINGMLAEIEYLMREVKAAGDNIAHDLRTPLTRLLAGLERAQRRTGSAAEYAVAVDEAIVELRGVLDTFSALLRIAEVESGARRAGFTAIDPAEVAIDVAEFYQPMAEEKAIALTVLPAGPASAQGDPGLLFEALANLVDNAIKYTPAGGVVTVRSAGASGGPGFTVSDSGPGISPTERDLVLRRFHRTEESRHSPGTGLGLALVAAVARLHTMELVIADGAPGCCVTLTWPGETLRD